MIGYVTLGTNNFEKAATFYDSLLGLMGAGRFMESDSFIAWAVSPGQPALSIIKPYDGQNACIGNGVMIALIADSTEKVDELYNKAISLGATDEGKPGFRNEGGIYVAYFRDLDGNKLNFFCMPS
jgi:catechol 2,3-dioxygenase-like lactoylglutathione lyase family enzyme